MGECTGSEPTTVTVAAEPAGKVLIVRAMLAPSCEARMVVDTGAGTSAISLACAERLGLAVHRRLQVKTPTGQTAVGTVDLPLLAVGDLRVGPLQVAAIPLPDPRVDGLLGLDFFRAVGAVSVTITLDPPSGGVHLRG